MNFTAQGRVTSWCCNYEPLLDATAHVGFRSGSEVCPHGIAWSGVHDSTGSSHTLIDPGLALTRATGSAIASSTMVGLSLWTMIVARLHHESVVFAASGFFSMMYHIAESLDCTVLWIAPSHWHRLDNTCGVYAFCLVVLGTVGLHSRSARRARSDTLRTFALLCTLIAQEVNAWSMVGGAVLPVLIIMLCSAVDVALSGARRARLVVLLFRLDTPLGAGSVALATLCFALSLDRGIDHLRGLHGLWHVLLSSGYLLLLRGAAAVDALRRDGSGAGGHGGENGSNWKEGPSNSERARLRGEVPSGCCFGLRLADLLDSVATRGGARGGAAHRTERERATEAGEGAPLLSASRTPRPRHPRLHALRAQRTVGAIIAETHGESGMASPLDSPLDSPLGTDSYYENVDSPLLPSPLHLAEDDSFFGGDQSPIGAP